MFILNHFGRVKTLVLPNKQINMYVGNTYILERTYELRPQMLHQLIIIIHLLY